MLGASIRTIIATVLVKALAAALFVTGLPARETAAQATAAPDPAAPAPAKKTEPKAAKKKSPPAAVETAKADAKDEPKKKAKGLSIAVLVNDEAITGYEIEKRAALLAMNSGGGVSADLKAKAEARWKQIVKDPKTQEKFQAVLKQNNVATKEQAQALQAKFIKDLQRDMIEKLRNEGRGNAVAGSRQKAIDELIEEKLKLQEAKRLNALADDADVEKILTGIAERNKVTLDKFAANLGEMGTDISTMRSRFKAEISWREVVRRRFGHQVAITDREVDRLVAANPSVEDDEVELQVQRITLPMPGKVDQKMIAKRIAEADDLASKYTGCTSTQVIAAGVPGAKFEDLGSRKPASFQEPTRSLLLNARDGDMLPASVGPAGVELWTVCSSKVLKGPEQKRENAQAELRQQEFEVLAKKALKDLRQDAAIEYR